MKWICFFLGCFLYADTTIEVFSKYPNRYFVETGSYVGDGIQKALLAGFEVIYSIELSPTLFRMCRNRFRDKPQVHLFIGDSSVKMEEILNKIDGPATFWLDGHYSEGTTARGFVNTPVLFELDAIKKHAVKNHTILIDDIRIMGSSQFDYITLRQIKKKICEINPQYEFIFETGHILNDVFVAKINNEMRNDLVKDESRFSIEKVKKINPSSISLTPNEKLAYVTNFSGAEVGIIDLSTCESVANFNVGANPNALVFESSGLYAFVANFSSHNISIVNTLENIELMTVPVGNGPVALNITPEGRFIYVVNESSNNVSVIDLTMIPKEYFRIRNKDESKNEFDKDILKNAVIATIAVGSSPESISITPDGKLAYVSNYRDNSISVIDIMTNRLINTILVQEGPYSVAIAPDGNRIYVVNSLSNTVSVIDTRANIAIHTIEVGISPLAAIVSSDGKYLYVVNNGSDSISIIETCHNTLERTIAVGVSPLGIAKLSNSQFLFVANEGSGSVSIIDTINNVVKSTVKIKIDEDDR